MALLLNLSWTTLGSCLDMNVVASFKQNILQRSPIYWGIGLLLAKIRMGGLIL